MTIDRLYNLNDMHEKIDELEKVIDEYESNAYLFFYIASWDDERNTYDQFYKLDPQLKNDILNVLKKRLEAAKKEFEEA